MTGHVIFCYAVRGRRWRARRGREMGDGRWERREERGERTTLRQKFAKRRSNFHTAPASERKGRASSSCREPWAARLECTLYQTDIITITRIN